MNLLACTSAYQPVAEEACQVKMMNQWVSTLFRSMGGRWHRGSLSLPSHSGSLQQAGTVSPLMGSRAQAVRNSSCPGCTLMRTSLASLTLCRRLGGPRSSLRAAVGTSPRWTQAHAWALRTCSPTRKLFAVSGCWDNQPHCLERCAAPPHLAWCLFASICTHT